MPIKARETDVECETPDARSSGRVSSFYVACQRVLLFACLKHTGLMTRK